MADFKILGYSGIRNPPKLPEYFLDSSKENAEKLFKEYSYLINCIANNYHMATGLEKADLFGEAMVALAVAKKDFDIKRSKDFKTFAIIKIKEALGEYVRSFSATVILPSYINKATAYYKKIKDELLKEGEHPDVVAVFKNNKVFNNQQLNNCKELIEKAAARANIDVVELIRRIELSPTKDTYDDQIVDNGDVDIHNMIVLKQIVHKLSPIEIKIIDGILSGKSYKEIGKEIDKSDAWVSNKIKDIKIMFTKDHGE